MCYRQSHYKESLYKHCCILIKRDNDGDRYKQRKRETQEKVEERRQSYGNRTDKQINMYTN